MPDNLIDAWLAASTTIYGSHEVDASQADAIRAMNAELGTRYTASRIGEWRRGDRVPSPQAMRYMAREAVAWVLRESGISTLRIEDDTLDQIADRLTVPV